MSLHSISIHFIHIHWCHALTHFHLVNNHSTTCIQMTLDRYNYHANLQHPSDKNKIKTAICMSTFTISHAIKDFAASKFGVHNQKHRYTTSEHMALTTQEKKAFQHTNTYTHTHTFINTTNINSKPPPPSLQTQKIKTKATCSQARLMQ